MAKVATSYAHDWPSASPSPSELARTVFTPMQMLSPAKSHDAELTQPKPSEHATLKFDRPDEFQTALKSRIDQYFQSTGKRPRDCWQMYVKSAVILAWFVGSYAMLVFGPMTPWLLVPVCASLGLAMSAIGFSIQHDGSHRGYSASSVVNKLAAMSLDILGGSSYYWARKHNTIHHTYANITGHDDDIELGVLGRLSPHQPRLKIHRIQHLYLWFLYGFIAIKWQFYDDFRDYFRGRIGSHPVARPRGMDLAVFLGGKLIFLLFAFVIPMMFHPAWHVLVAYFGVSFFQGVALSVVFQIAHCVEGVAFPMPEDGRIHNSFAAHQIETTVNFAPRNRLLSWFVGGLNYQIEHHLFPQICHIHYPALSPLVAQTCREYGVRYTVFDTFRSGVASHYRWLRTMGRAEA